MRRLILIPLLFVFLFAAQAQIIMRPIPRRSSGGFLIADYSAAAGTMTWKVTGTSSKQVTFTWGDGTDTTLTMTGAEQTLTHNYAKASFNLRISGDTGSVSRWTCNNAQLKGDVADLPTGAKQYYFYNTSISGDVADLPTGATQYYFYNTSISGDVADLPTGATYYYFYSTSISGDVADLPTGATYYLFNSTSISGDVADLPTGATYYLFNNTSISGDLNGFAALGTEVDIIYLYDCVNITGYTSATLQNVSADNAANIRVYSIGLTATEVDNFIIDLAAAQTGDGYLSIGGTNAARTSASNAAVAALLALGWDVLVNE
jgi:hypothetical protein